jgi:hypothetical protein
VSSTIYGILDFQAIGHRLFLRDVRINFLSVGKVVGECGEHLRRRQVADPRRDVLGTEAKAVPRGNPLHRDARPGEVRSSSPNAGSPENHRPNIGHGRHTGIPSSAITTASVPSVLAAELPDQGGKSVLELG